MCVCLDICPGRMEGTLWKGGENNGSAKQVHIVGFDLGREIGFLGREGIRKKVLTEV